MQGTVLLGAPSDVRFHFPAIVFMAGARQFARVTVVALLGQFFVSMFGGDFTSVTAAAEKSRWAIATLEEGRATIQNGAFAEGIKILDGIIESGTLPNEDLAIGLAVRAYGYLKLGNHAVALSDLDQSLKLAPNNPPVLLQRCWVHARLGNFISGKVDCDKAIRLNPELSAAYNSRAQIYEKLGYYEQAFRDYETGISLEISPYYLFANRGSLKYRLGDFSGAIQDYTEVVQTPNLPAVDKAIIFADRGQLFFVMKNYKNTVDDLSSAINLDPNKPRYFNNRCWVRTLVGDLALALEDCDKAVTLDPNNTHYLDSRGLTFYRLGHYEKALADLTEALTIQPDHPYALFHRGLVFESLGKIALAKQDFVDLRKIAPSWEVAVEKFDQYGIKAPSSNK